MNKQSTPQLTALRADTYRCDDIPALHSWLEAHSYTFYGQHDPGEYGRFSCQEAHETGERRSYVHSFIQVFADGQIYAPDPHAHNLLNTLVIDEPHERTV